MKLIIAVLILIIILLIKRIINDKNGYEYHSEWKSLELEKKNKKLEQIMGAISGYTFHTGGLDKRISENREIVENILKDPPKDKFLLVHIITCLVYHYLFLYNLYVSTPEMFDYARDEKINEDTSFYRDTLISIGVKTDCFVGMIEKINNTHSKGL